nr:hypothetical protein [Tanacetum cinerariifolium]
MNNEYNVLIKNNTWTLVPRPVDANVVRSNGGTQVSGIDVDENFSSVVKPATVRTILSWLLLDIVLFISLMSRMPSYMVIYLRRFICIGLKVLLQHIITSFYHEFSMTDIGSFNYFLGISVVCDSSRMFLSQLLRVALQYHTFTRLDISYAVQQVVKQENEEEEGGKVVKQENEEEEGGKV